jgi:hypothetical protein
VTPAGPGPKETTVTEQTDAFLTAWTTAEQAGDVRTLDRLLAADFYGVGPMGFILPKTAWLARHRAGGLVYTRFGLDEVQAVRHGEVTVLTARHTSAGTYQGHPVPEAARATLVTVSGHRQRRRDPQARRHPPELHRRHSRRAAPPRPGSAARAGRTAMSQART